jgi:hypothetical protein
VTKPPDLAPASERAALTAFRDKQRDILVRKIEGVSDDDARCADIIRESIDGSAGE